LHCEHTPGTVTRFECEFEAAPEGEVLPPPLPPLASFESAMPNARAYSASGDAKQASPTTKRGDAVRRNRCRFVEARCRASRRAAAFSALVPRAAGHSSAAEAAAVADADEEETDKDECEFAECDKEKADDAAKCGEKEADDEEASEE
jgi:hypothetical protein